MTPKREAREIYVLYACILNDARIAKKCALIAVDEIIKQFTAIFNQIKEAGFYNTNVEDSANFKYWQEVKQEIEKI